MNNKLERKQNSISFNNELQTIKHYKQNNNMLFNIIFGVILTLSLGTLWELTEFDIDQIFKTNMQSIETGLLDTMKDLSIAAITSIITSIIYLKKQYRYEKLNYS